MVEAARLELLALFRALDRLHLAQGLPPLLHELFELDADLAEGLWALEQPRGQLDLKAMTRDTLASLAAIPRVRSEFLGRFDEELRECVAACTVAVRSTLKPEEAYNQLPGHNG
jgi:hypothetical protein